MKIILLFIGLILTFSNLTAQKKIIKNTKASGINEVYVHVKFADKIEKKNWNKNEISIQAIVNINENKGNEHFSLKEDKVGSTYTITSDYGKLFKKHKKEITITHNSKGFNRSNNYANKHKINIDYVIYVPKNMKLKVKSISGNIDALAYKGQLTLDLISGDITIKKQAQIMNLKTISGDIDVVVSDAEFKAETLTGTVYSDLNIDFDKKRKISHGSQKIYGTVKNGTASLKLKTISGDIFLRKN